jgi:sugar phosphate isomerase/epimerase
MSHLTPGQTGDAIMSSSGNPFGICINTSTTRGQKLSLPDEIALTAKAGYQGIEPWVAELDAFVEGGGDLKDIASQLQDCGLVVPNLIGFFEWGVPDAERRKAGFEEARRNMELAAQIGCRGLAAPPMGLKDATGIDLFQMAESYAKLIDMGEEFGVTPILEFWGVAKTLGHLGEALLILAECGRPEACLLVDVFHMYKGTGHFEGLRHLGKGTVGLVHINDYPAEPNRAMAVDADRVYPGDGIAPLGQILRDLRSAGYDGMLSLELFNKAYWEQDALTVARTGREKVQRVVESALAD